ncbi:craniofacial development protein 2-like [Penaeus indicus]|uniref:craniofacial development protein 2-like n=1 Tax=Penaeus indicus TaxID=29960 RepID=UPI00300C5ECD
MVMKTLGNKANSVKGISVTDLDSSLGTAVHGKQVAPDRHQITACNTTKRPLRIGTWNVRTLYQCGKLDNVKLEMIRLKVNILGICETRWTGSEEFNSEDLHSGGEKHELGVAVMLDKESAKSLVGWFALSDRVMLVKLKGKQVDISIIQVYAPTTASSEEEIDKFYDTLEKAKQQCKSTDVTMILGDLNAKVGIETDGETVGKFGLDTQNDRGERWLQWCKANEYVLTNTWYEQHPRRLWTWRSPGDNVKNQITYIAIKKRYRGAIQQSKAYPGADHNPVICKLKLKLKTIKKGKVTPRMEYNALLKNENIREEYAVAVQNRFKALEDEGKAKWDTFKEATVLVAKELVPKREKKSKNKWMTEDILERMRLRQQIHSRQSDEYKLASKEIRKKCREAKEIWLNKQCEEMER